MKQEFDVEADGESTAQPLLVDLLVEHGLVQQKDLDKAFRLQKERSMSLERALVEAEVISDAKVAEALSLHLGVPLYDLDAWAGPDGDLPKLPEKLLRNHGIVPLYVEAGAIHVAMVDPSDLSVLQDIQVTCGLTPIRYVVPVLQAERALDRLFGTRDEVKEITAESPDVHEVEEEEEEFLDLDKQIPDTKDTQVLRIVNGIVKQAIAERASDIHLEPLPDQVSIRFRIDGALQHRPAPSRGLYVPMLSRLKILAKMDIGEKRLPQDGAISVRYKGDSIDLRVSTVPVIFGEKMVIRILNKNAMPVGLDNLGFDEQQRRLFLTAAKSPNGLILVTGPTGSGKSTTLYGVLSILKSPTKNIVTVEDPVEYKLPGINQVHVRSGIGLTFASVLRTFLRQDPDVIMVGEVRDQETAQICLRAALTGHLVLSTLHTNDALSSITRLVDMGIDPFLVASTLRLVEAQRLLRRLCRECKEPCSVDPETAERYRIPRDQTIYRPKGCPACKGVGYKGRVGIFEVVLVTPTLRDLIQSRATLAVLQRQAEAEDMSSLGTQGIKKVIEGVTSLEEVLALIMGGGE